MKEIPKLKRFFALGSSQEVSAVVLLNIYWQPITVESYM